VRRVERLDDRDTVFLASLYRQTEGEQTLFLLA
jgi:hypothetical protein